MSKQDKNAKDMPGHSSRTSKGRLRKIRGDTQMGTLEDRYDTDFGVRDDMRWDTFKQKKGVGSVNKAIDKYGN